MITKTLKDGTIQHTLDNWIGIQAVGDTMVKTKWRRTDMEYYDVGGYTQMRNSIGNLTCTCKGFYFRKKCRHITEVQSY